MPSTDIDILLRPLTESEHAYKAKLLPPFLTRMPLVIHNGLEVYQLNFNSGVTPGGRIPAADQRLFLKKQSRFQPCPLHIHDWLEINYMYSGKCQQTINHSNYLLHKGQICIIDSDTPHATAELGEDDILLSLVIQKEYFNNQFFSRLSGNSILADFFINAIQQDTNHNNYILFHSENSRRIQLYFHELIRESYHPTLGSNDIVDSLLTLIFCELINIYENNASLHDVSFHSNSIGNILRYLATNYRTCSLKSTAAAFNLNPNYLTSLLKKTTGFSYKQLIVRERLNYAAHYLRSTNLPINEIAHLSGYENISFFYRKFNEIFQCSPHEYRMM